jgi:hypothetical protein
MGRIHVRLNPMRQTEVREKIRARALVRALENHILKKTKMESSAVTAALGLLKKCVPDLQRSELTGKDGESIAVLVRAADHDENL